MFINKLKQWISSFISFLGLSQTDTSKDDIYTEDMIGQTSETYHDNFNNLCNKSSEENNHHSFISLTSINWDLIHQIHKGDIVYVKMEDEVILKDQISLYHQHRPFVVVGKDSDHNKLYGYYTTHNIDNHYIHGGSKIILNKDYHNLKYHSLVLVHRKVELPYENVIRKISRVSNSVLSQINDKAQLEQKFTNGSTCVSRIIETKDIIQDQETMYLIYEHNSSFAYGFPIMMATHRPKKASDHDYYRYFPFNHKLYFVDFDRPTTFSRTGEYEIVNTISMTTVLDILKQREHLKYLLKKEKKKQKKLKK